MLIGCLVAALVIAVPIAWASHDFTDVPDASPFHFDISAVKGAGITSGKTCVPPGTPPTYCPSEGITREAMAAFVHRGFGRVARAGGFSVELPTSGIALNIGQINLVIGGVSGTQFVKVDGSVGTVIGSTSGCPCNTGYWIEAVDLAQTTYLHVNTNADVAPGFNNVGEEHGTVSAVFAVPAGSLQRFRLWATRPVDSTGTVNAYSDMTAIVAPFGFLGNSTLGAQLTDTPPSGTPPSSPPIRG